MSIKLSVGVDLGSGNTALSVYHHERMCAIPMEIGDEKILPTSIAVPEGNEQMIVGKRALTRPVRRCDGVLCAYRQMLYAMEPAWAVQRALCNQKWHFEVEEEGADERAREQHGGQYLVRGRLFSVKQLVEEVIEVICACLLEAIMPEGRLEIESGRQVEFVNFGVSVAECCGDAQRSLVHSAAQRVVQRRLSPATKVHVVTDTLASAMQVCSIAPFQKRSMLLVDFGASKLSVSLFVFEESPVDLAFSLREVVSKTNVFVGGDEMEFRMLKWCEDRRPFPESLLGSKSAVFKLRREVRSAIKTLTVAEEAMIDVDSLVAGKDLVVMLRLEDFERECSDIFESVGELVDEVVRAGEIGFPKDVVLVGGCTRVPRVQKVLCPHRVATAAGASVRKPLDLDRAVSLGVATVCALKHDPSVVRVPLDPAHAYEEQLERLQLCSILQREYSSDLGNLAGQPNDVQSLSALCKQLRRHNAALLESEAKLRAQLLLQQEAFGVAMSPTTTPTSVESGDGRLELVDRIRLAEETARAANASAQQIQAEKEQMEMFAERRVRSAEEAVGELRHKYQQSQKSLQRAEGEIRGLREEVTTLRKDAEASEAKATRYEEEVARLHADFKALKVQLHQLQPLAKPSSLGESGAASPSSRTSFSFSGSASPGPQKSSQVSQAFIPEQVVSEPPALTEPSRTGSSQSSGGETQRSYAARQLKRFWNF